MPADLFRLPARNQEGAWYVVVESPRGAPVKFKYDPEMGVFTISRPLPWGMVYPFDWGFIPGTKGPDGDPIDAMILWDVPTAPGVVVPCRAIGALKVDQAKANGRGRERNDRVLLVPLVAQRMQRLREAMDLEKRERDELVQFFLATTALEGKDLKILGWTSSKAANKLIEDAMED